VFFVVFTTLVKQFKGELRTWGGLAHVGSWLFFPPQPEIVWVERGGLVRSGGAV